MHIQSKFNYLNSNHIKEYLFISFLTTVCIIAIFLIDLATSYFISQITATQHIQTIQNMIANYQNNLVSNANNKVLMPNGNMKANSTVKDNHNSCYQIEPCSSKLAVTLESANYSSANTNKIYTLSNCPNYIFLEKTGKGMWGDITIMIGFDIINKKIIGIEILHHSETAGIGSKIEDQAFKNKFIGLSYGPLQINAVKNKVNESEFEIITGATISSKAVENILNDAIKYIYKNFHHN